ncbi:hypothetical protein JCM10512_311 [Bacteroides reticulotermitis JCM 10512]|uniref:Uncharacterized protein n=1 Tax=Bacteroides reticulotermitis JCM 10512 TaxID=1445607 RepID=W4UNB8_9BACE|nr:hypothetical protein JCM10512_311 [Bacteroides reticulotermitis JCM 10512]
MGRDFYQFKFVILKNFFLQKDGVIIKGRRKIQFSNGKQPRLKEFENAIMETKIKNLVEMTNQTNDKSNIY